MRTRGVYQVLTCEQKTLALADSAYADLLVARGQTCIRTIRHLRQQRQTQLSTPIPPPDSQEEAISQMITEVSPLMHKTTRKSLIKAVHSLVVAQSAMPSKVFGKHAALYRTYAKNSKNQWEYLMSNEKLWTDHLLTSWIRYNINGMKEVIVSIDWTEFHRDQHHCFAVCLLFADKMSIPIYVKTIGHDDISAANPCRTSKIAVVEATLEFISKVITDKPVVIVGDREFGTVPYLTLYDQYRLSYCCRTDNDIWIRDEEMESHKSPEWLAKGEKQLAPLVHPDDEKRVTRSVAAQRGATAKVLSRTMVIPNAKVTREHSYAAPKVVVHKSAGMKDIWTIVTNLPELSARTLLDLYANRWSCETGFKHQKDLGTGLGLKAVHMTGKDSCLRMDRTWFLMSMACKHWLVLGQVSEMIGCNWLVETRTNTARAKAAKRELSVHMLGRKIGDYFRHSPDRQDEMQLQVWAKCAQVSASFALFHDRSLKKGALCPG